MQQISNRYVGVVAFGLLALAGARSASAEVIYSTGFEANQGFSPGQLNGQQGWRSFGNPAGVTVTPAAALSGALGVQISGTALQPSLFVADRLIGGADAGGYFDGGTSLPLEFAADFRFSGPDGGTSEADALLAFFEFYSPNDVYIGGVAFDYVNTSAADFLTVARLAVRFDAIRQVSEVFLDGDLLFTEPIAPGANYTGLAYPQISLFASNDPMKVNPALYSVSFDNFSVASVPEPTSLAVLAGGVAVGLRRRRAR